MGSRCHGIYAPPGYRDRFGHCSHAAVCRRRRFSVTPVDSECDSECDQSTQSVVYWFFGSFFFGFLVFGSHSESTPPSPCSLQPPSPSTGARAAASAEGPRLPAGQPAGPIRARPPSGPLAGPVPLPAGRRGPFLLLLCRAAARRWLCPPFPSGRPLERGWVPSAGSAWSPPGASSESYGVDTRPHQLVGGRARNPDERLEPRGPVSAAAIKTYCSPPVVKWYLDVGRSALKADGRALCTEIPAAVYSLPVVYSLPILQGKRSRAGSQGPRSIIRAMSFQRNGCCQRHWAHGHLQAAVTLGRAACSCKMILRSDLTGSLLRYQQVDAATARIPDDYLACNVIMSQRREGGQVVEVVPGGRGGEEEDCKCDDRSKDRICVWAYAAVMLL